MQAEEVIPRIKRIATNRRTAALAVEAVVFIYALVEVASLAVRHTTGPEIYGVVVALLAAVAGGVSVALLASRKRWLIATALVVVLWIIVGLGGIAGAVVHATGTGPEAGVVDSRPRPQGAPLIFTALAVVGGGVLVYGKRGSGAARDRQS
jgi:hypothetical protein